MVQANNRKVEFNTEFLKRQTMMKKMLKQVAWNEGKMSKNQKQNIEEFVKFQRFLADIMTVKISKTLAEKRLTVAFKNTNALLRASTQLRSS